jgi:hypothetical protein
MLKNSREDGLGSLEGPLSLHALLFRQVHPLKEVRGLAGERKCHTRARRYRNVEREFRKKDAYGLGTNGIFYPCLLWPYLGCA